MTDILAFILGITYGVVLTLIFTVNKEDKH